MYHILNAYRKWGYVFIEERQCEELCNVFCKNIVEGFFFILYNVFNLVYTGVMVSVTSGPKRSKVIGERNRQTSEKAFLC